MPQFSFQQPFTGVVRHLIIINVLMFFGTNMLMGDGVGSDTGGFDYLGRLSLAAFMPGSAYFEPYQIATYMFMHGNFPHILFNMMTLYFFGPMIEMVWGDKRFLFYYFSCGVGAYFIYMGVQYWELSSAGIDPSSWNVPMLGASGAIFGVLTAFAYLFPNQVVSLLFPPVSIKAKYFVPIMALLELIYGVQRTSTGVAHFAHLGGAITGIIIIMLWYRFKLR